MPVINGVTTLLPAPEGYVVDFANPQRQAVPDSYYVAGFGVFFSVLLMVQRLYTKIFLSGGLQTDDVLLIFAWLTSLTTVAICVHMFGTGVGGVHGWEISITQFNSFMLDIYIASIIYTLSGSFAKISLLVFYLRLSPQRWFKYSIYATMAIIAGYSIGIFFALIFACDKIAMNWDVTVTGGKCINRPGLYIATAVANIASDIVLFILPIPMDKELQIPLKQKIGLSFIFAIGSLTVVSSIVRVSILPQLLVSLDQTWTVSYASLWIIVEANLLIICAALPTLRKFFRHVAPKLIGESTYGKSTTKTTGNFTGSKLRYGPGTNGTKRDRNEYDKFGGEGGSETYIMSNVGPGAGVGAGGGIGGKSSEEGVRSGVVLDGQETLWRDDDSEEGIVGGKGDIVQTTTITVEHSGGKGRK